MLVDCTVDASRSHAAAKSAAVRIEHLRNLLNIAAVEYHIVMASVVPSETDILCEACGYTLNGLPGNSNCPECGQTIESSTTAAGRGMTGFEERSGLSSFVATTIAVLLRPKKFYRALATRKSHPAAEWFAQRHRFIAAFLFTGAGLGYALWVESMRMRPRLLGRDTLALPMVWLFGSIGLYFLMTGITRLAAWLSSMEGAYWGMRLPLPVVQRCLRYHTAAYLPIAIVANILVWGWRWAVSFWPMLAIYGVQFAVSLSVAVVLSAWYLFWMYMVAMRNTRYANS